MVAGRTDNGAPRRCIPLPEFHGASLLRCPPHALTAVKNRHQVLVKKMARAHPIASACPGLFSLRPSPWLSSWLV